MPLTPPPGVAVPTVLVTGAARRLGREIALALAAAGWRVAVHYRSSLDDATKTVADCGQLTRGAAAFHANLDDEMAVRGLLPTVVQAMGYVDAVVNSASTFEHDTNASFSFASMEKHMLSNAGAAIVLAQALHTHITARGELPAGPPQGSYDPAGGSDPRSGGAWGRGVVVNLLDQKLWNQNPDFFSYTLSIQFHRKSDAVTRLSRLSLVGFALVQATGAAIILALIDQARQAVPYRWTLGNLSLRHFANGT